MRRDQDAARMTFADEPAPSNAAEASVRRDAACRAALAVRLIVAPLAALTAAITGLLFAVLLPICGIATICEGIAKTSWRFLRQLAAAGPRPRERRI